MYLPLCMFCGMLMSNIVSAKFSNIFKYLQSRTSIEAGGGGGTRPKLGVVLGYGTKTCDVCIPAM